jgi:hypothetical protein
VFSGVSAGREIVGVGDEKDEGSGIKDEMGVGAGVTPATGSRKV